MRTKIFFLFTTALSVTYLHAQLSQDTVALLEKIISRHTQTTPGVQLAISRNGQVIYSSARGMADLEHNAPMLTTSKTEAGSVSKQFTAAAILLLEQQGKLSIDDDIRKYIPELPDYGYTITIRHMMNHASGLKDWGSVAEVAGWPRGTKTYNNDDALQIITQQKTLNHKPGEEYIYSNTNYTLQTIIVERVSGTSHAAFTTKYIFEPAGMTNTEWRDNYKKVVPGRAMAYNKSGNTYLTNMPNEYVYGHGGLLTTAEDLLLWNQFYFSGKFGSPSLLSKQLETRPFNNGKHNNYAAGLVVDSANGEAVITHSGATAGYRANLDYFPKPGLSIAWLSNTSQGDMQNTAAAARALFIKKTESKKEEEVVSKPGIPVNTFLPYLGAYREEKTGAGIRLYLKDNAVYSVTNGGPLPILSQNMLAAGRARIIFFSAKPRTIHFVTAGGDTVLYTGVDTVQAGVAALQEYAGMYYSEEADAKMKLFVKDGKLVIKRREEETILNPVYKDGFSFPGGDVYFERNKKGKPVRFFVSVSRARKIGFVKMDQ